MWKGDTVETLEEAKPGDVYHGIRIGQADGPNGAPAFGSVSGTGFKDFMSPTALHNRVAELEARLTVVEGWLRDRHQIK